MATQTQFNQMGEDLLRFFEKPHLTFVHEQFLTVFRQIKNHFQDGSLIDFNESKIDLMNVLCALLYTVQQAGFKREEWGDWDLDKVQRHILTMIELLRKIVQLGPTTSNYPSAP